MTGSPGGIRKKFFTATALTIIVALLILLVTHASRQE